MSSRIRGISSFWGNTKGLSEIKEEKGEKERGKRWGPKRGLGAPQALENTKKEENDNRNQSKSVISSMDFHFLRSVRF